MSLLSILLKGKRTTPEEDQQENEEGYRSWLATTPGAQQMNEEDALPNGIFGQLSRRIHPESKPAYTPSAEGTEAPQEKRLTMADLLNPESMAKEMVSVQKEASSRAPAQIQNPQVKEYLAKKYGYGEELDDQALEDAQNQASDDRMWARMGEAGANLGAAIAGVQSPDPSFYRGVAKDAGQNVADIKERRAGQIEDLKFGAASRDMDPQGRSADVLRQVYAPVLKKMGIDPNVLSGMSSDEIKSFIQHPVEEFNKSEDRKLGYEMARLSKEALLSQKEGEARDRQTRFEDTKIKDHAEDLNKTGVADAVTTINELEDLIGGVDSKGDIPGYGRVEGMVPDWMLPGESKSEKVRSVVQRLANIVIKDRSGAQVTAPEFERFKKEFGTGTLVSDSKLREALSLYKKALQSKLGTFEAGLDPRVLDRYKSHSGSISSDSFRNGMRKPDISEDTMRNALKAGYTPEQIREYLRGKR